MTNTPIGYVTHILTKPHPIDETVFMSYYKIVDCSIDNAMDGVIICYTQSPIDKGRYNMSMLGFNTDNDSKTTFNMYQDIMNNCYSWEPLDILGTFETEDDILSMCSLGVATIH